MTFFAGSAPARKAWRAGSTRARICVPGGDGREMVGRHALEQRPRAGPGRRIEHADHERDQARGQPRGRRDGVVPRRHRLEQLEQLRPGQRACRELQQAFEWTERARIRGRGEFLEAFAFRLARIGCRETA